MARISTWWLAAVALCTTAHAALTQFEYLQVAENLSKQFIFPNNIAQAESINSTLFSEDVVGTVDATTNFDGRELATEYLFGLFVSLAKDRRDPSPLGLPVDYNVSIAFVQGANVAVGVKFDFEYPVLKKRFPIELLAYFTINDNKEITEYDVVFRRWAWGASVLTPQLIPHMAKYNNQPPELAKNASYVLRYYLANATCTAATRYCFGENLQYDSYDSCMAYMDTLPIGEFNRMGDHNVACRYVHAPMLHLRPSLHCAHVGPTGGDMCVTRDYEEVVRTERFPHGFIGMRSITPENKAEVSHIKLGAKYPLPRLLEISLGLKETKTYTPTYSTATFAFFLIVYLTSRLVHRKNPDFRSLTWGKRGKGLRRGLQYQKGVETAIVHIIFTTIALGLHLVSIPALWRNYSLAGAQCVVLACAIISTVYVFDLTHKPQEPLALVLHHLLTIVVFALTIGIFENVQSMSWLNSLIVWLFQATTDQALCLGYIGFHMGWDARLVYRLLKWGAYQTMVIKTLSTVALLTIWFMYQSTPHRAIDTVWTVSVWVLGWALLATQGCMAWKALHWAEKVAIANDLKVGTGTITLAQTISESPLIMEFEEREQAFNRAERQREEQLFTQGRDPALEQAEQQDQAFDEHGRVTDSPEHDSDSGESSSSEPDHIEELPSEGTTLDHWHVRMRNGVRRVVGSRSSTFDGIV